MTGRRRQRVISRAMIREFPHEVVTVFLMPERRTEAIQWCLDSITAPALFHSPYEGAVRLWRTWGERLLRADAAGPGGTSRKVGETFRFKSSGDAAMFKLAFGY